MTEPSDTPPTGRSTVSAAGEATRPMPTYHRIEPPFRNRDQELAQAFREAVAQAHDHGTHVEYLGKPLHPRVEDDDYNCPNEWCQRFWSMVREAEDRAAASPAGPEAVPQSEREGLDGIMAEHRLCDTGKYSGCYAHWPTPHCRADGMSWPCDVDAIRAALASPAHPDEE